MTKRKKIIVIEDNQDVRENIVEILSLSGYDTVEAENGKIGVNKIREEKPDLIICDVMMPELDGFGVLKILNNHPELFKIPFMFLTAKAEKTDFRKGMGLGADDYITKPFDDVELLDSIEMRLAKSDRLNSLENNEDGVRKLYSEARAKEGFQTLSENREIRKYNKKDIIYEHGHKPRFLFLILSGQIKCSQTNDFGKELITHIYGPGDFFGYLSLLKDHLYEDTAIAVGNAEIILIPAEDFKLLLFNNRDFSSKFIQMLASKAEQVEKQLLEIAYSSVRKKIANALLELQSKYQNEQFKALREDIANMAGTAKETAIRTLSDFQSERIIDLDGSRIKIIDKEALIDMPQ